MALVTSNPSPLAPGSPLPDFRVAVAGAGELESSVVRESLLKSRGLVVAVICNHCPHVRAAEDRMIELASETVPKGIAWLAVNPNAANPDYPEDSLERMTERMRGGAYPFAYAADSDQSLSRALGAACTPEFFLFDRTARLVYTGALEDSRAASGSPARPLFEAIEDLLAARTVRVAATHPLGCSIKWLEPR